jgi:phosphoserine aminotransferase
MNTQLFFTPGPAELYPTVPTHIQTAIAEQIGSISHRSQKFRDIYKFTATQLRTLMNIPDSHAILFTGSATEVWERMLMNTVEHESFHLVNGSFSQKFYEFSTQLHKYAHKFEKPFGEGFSYDDFIKPATEKALGKKNAQEHESKVRIADYAELVCITHNETSSGVKMPVVDIHQLKRSYSDKLFCVDMVSSAPYPDFNWELIDSAFFSVQKAFGLPAGLGVWIANHKCLDKAKRMKLHEGTIGTYHSLPSLWKNYEKFETPETPNVWNIFLLGKVAEDMNNKGVDTIRKETEQKAKMLYDFASKNNRFEVFVKNPAHRSQTVVVLNVEKPADLIAQVKANSNMVIGGGYGDFKNSQIRIANFPAVSIEQVEALIEQLKY